MRIVETTTPRDEAFLASTLNNVGGVYERGGLYEAARSQFERVYEIRLRTLGLEHPLTAHPLNNLGNAYYDEGRYAEAKDHYQRALEILEGALGPDHLHVSFPRVGLGRVARKTERWAEAAAQLARVLEIREGAGSAPESIAEVRFDLAQVQWEIAERRDDAVAEARRALAQAEQAEDDSSDLMALRAEVRDWDSRSARRAVMGPEWCVALVGGATLQA